jgi:hypothetical protein
MTAKLRKTILAVKLQKQFLRSCAGQLQVTTTTTNNNQQQQQPQQPQPQPISNMSDAAHAPTAYLAGVMDNLITDASQMEDQRDAALAKVAELKTELLLWT